MAIRTVFVGSSVESLAILETLVESNEYKVEGIITKPNKPVGRKREVQMTPINAFAQSNSIPTVHPENKTEEYQKALDLFKPELTICIAFGEILPEFFINYPKYKTINIHFSLLPAYRGAIPVQKAILNGETETGITYILMNDKLDAGDMLAQFKVNISEYDDNETLRAKLLKESQKSLISVLNKWVDGKINPVVQDDTKATYCYKKELNKENAQINWDEWEPDYIERVIKAFVPWPVAWTYINNVRVKIFKGQHIDASATDIKLAPGEAKGINRRLFIGTKVPSIFIQVMELQPDGGKRMTGESYLNGQDL
jgi:methionyl-tRNA formyltransferase